MNIYRFINSRDIRKYLEDMKYEFDALEASWLVSQCQEATLEEKHSAWKWIIDNMPDMEVRERINCSYRESLHDTLNKYMALDEDLLEEFFVEEEGVYTYRCFEDGNEIGILTQERAIFFYYEDCFRSVKEFMEDTRERFAEKSLSPDELRYYKMRTITDVVRHFKDNDHKIVVTYDINCRIKDVDVWNSDNDEHYELKSRFFEGCWFDFPIPFKKGDIVYKVGDHLDGPEAFCFNHGIFVLDDLITWFIKDNEKMRKTYTESVSGDTSDMTAYGYYLREDGSIYNECNSTYMDLELYRGPLIGIRRVYKALSNYLKGEIGIELFSYAYRTFILEKNHEDFISNNIFTEEGQKLAGLLDE